MEYKPLATLFHMSSSTNRKAEVEAELARRLEADSTFRTGLTTPAGELFVAMPRELTTLMESILRLERRVSALLHALPPIAHGALARSLIVDEIVSTNELEGVHSTRAQIARLLENSPKTGAHDRFREFTKLYLELSEDQRVEPTGAEDIRRMYDRVMDGEALEGIEPDGRLFHAGGVVVVGAGGKILHEGVQPEETIIEALEQTIEFATSPDIPELIGAIAGHYMFEYVHPFYDGNGRTGRYLLALHLSSPLSLATALSLSRVIAENRARYYRAFREAEDPLNHGELTFFVMVMMELIRTAQEELVENLTEKARRLEDARAAIMDMANSRTLGEKEAEALFHPAQASIFGAFPDTTLEEIAINLEVGAQMARKYVGRLETAGLVKRVGTRPLRFALATKPYQ
ncbi:MAG: Fic family protein [Coriobacteriales bacterium]|jgi:Fic family protein